MHVESVGVILVQSRNITFSFIAQKNSPKKRLDEFWSSLKFKYFYYKFNLKKKILEV